MRYTLLLSFINIFPMVKELLSKHEECAFLQCGNNQGTITIGKIIVPKHADNISGANMLAPISGLKRKIVIYEV